MFRSLFVQPLRYSTHRNITVTFRQEKVGIIQLNRPDTLNSLTQELFSELTFALKDLDSNRNIGAIIITGTEKAFAGTFNIYIQLSSYIYILDDVCAFTYSSANSRGRH